MNKEKLKEILELHEKWLKDDERGKMADLADANLSGADLGCANLSGADLSHADLRGASLSDADLRYADLSDANLRYADLSDADLSGADLRCANLRYADLSDANLSDADLRCANLRYADLSDADLRCANLSDVKYNEHTSFFALQCPEQGSFIAWKKSQGKIVKLRVTENALRSSATSRKCRCSEAEVLEIDDGNLQEICSGYDESFVYKVGEIVKVDDFDTDRWNECSTGIHFFITRQEAENY